MDPYGLTPLLLSLRVAGLATLLAFLLGLPFALLLARGRFPGKGLVETLVLIPLVLPPTVMGYYLLVAVGRASPLGRGLEALVGWSPLFTWQAAVLAALVAAAPLLIKAAQAAFESVDHTLEDAARTLGKDEAEVFFRVTIPLAWRGLVAGGILTFARAMGEFGITLMIAGNIPGVTQTMPLAIYDAVQANRLAAAHTLSLIALGAVAALLLVLGRLTRVRL
ncbi:MAG: molybdate ABC transporter permease subunit [Deltaproteobacteria bacterium]|nr:molybdate ABC transporter permease subunit [Deltaproteobacteria bacterium]